ncbi:PaREP1 family protein [Sulfurisphaera ohwakuensis]|uniref:PaREP1 family protein n=1 Tax=Sulfurisphaera ohwakuensis TaxID=69656 RepID=UPI0036F2689E
MRLPPTLVKELIRMNVDEADIAELVLSSFNIDDDLKPKIYSELSQITLERACELLKGGNLSEAVDKLCKSVELIIRSLALSKKIDEAIKNENEGKWTPKSMEKIAEKLGLSSYLSSVYSLIDRQPSEKEIKERIENIKKIITKYYND